MRSKFSVGRGDATVSVGDKKKDGDTSVWDDEKGGRKASKKKNFTAKEAFIEAAINSGAAISSWFENRLEEDRAKLTLSSGAIGLLATLYCGFNEKLPVAPSVLMLVAMGFFLVTAIIMIVVFRKNSTYLYDVITKREASDISYFDVLSWIFFGLGLATTVAFIIVFVITRLT